MSPIWQTVIGAAAAIVGGMLAAWWQTSRADAIARRVRQEERREQGLFTLRAMLADIRSRVNYLYRQAEATPLTGQYQAASAALAELGTAWRANLSGVIPDGSIVKAYAALNGAAHDLFPGGPDAMMQYLNEDFAAKAQHFVRDLGHVLGLIDELVKATDTVVSGLAYPRPALSLLRRVGHSKGKRALH